MVAETDFTSPIYKIFEAFCILFLRKGLEMLRAPASWAPRTARESRNLRLFSALTELKFRMKTDANGGLSLTRN